MNDHLLELEAEIAALLKERSEIHKQISPLQERLVAIAEKLDPLREERAKIVYADTVSLDWKKVVKTLAGDEWNSQFLLRRTEKVLWATYDMFHSGYWTDTNEANFHVKVERTEESKAKNLAGVRFFAKVFTPHEDGYIWFGVFEHTLSRGGVFTLKVKPDLSECVLEHSYASDVPFYTLEEAIDYIANHHWYGD